MSILKPLSLTLCFCLSWFYLSSESLAQMNSPDNSGFQQNEYNSIIGPSGLDPIDLIHRANFGTFRTSEQFRSDSQQNLDNAATDFKLQQQQLWENQQQNTPE